MNEDKRSNPICCPQHGKTYLWGNNNKIECSVPNCGWSVPARRETDKEIPTSTEVKENWR
jgi:hypothetical protein